MCLFEVTQCLLCLRTMSLRLLCFLADTTITSIKPVNFDKLSDETTTQVRKQMIIPDSGDCRDEQGYYYQVNYRHVVHLFGLGTLYKPS